MFKGLANIASMLKQAQQMGGKLQEITDELRAKRVTGASGGGLVEVEATGTGEIIRVKFDAKLSLADDREMIEDLLPAAINQALAKAKQLHAEAMQSLTQGMNIPGLDDAIAKMTGNPPGEP